MGEHSFPAFQFDRNATVRQQIDHNRFQASWRILRGIARTRIGHLTESHKSYGFVKGA